MHRLSDHSGEQYGADKGIGAGRPAPRRGDCGRVPRRTDHQLHLSATEQEVMEVAVINFSGNVGKTAVARHLLTPPHHRCRNDRRQKGTNADDGQAPAANATQLNGASGGFRRPGAASRRGRVGRRCSSPTEAAALPRRPESSRRGLQSGRPASGATQYWRESRRGASPLSVEDHHVGPFTRRQGSDMSL